MQSKVWKIVGKLIEYRDDDRKVKPDARVVYLVQDDFPTNEEAETALLHNWSSRPHAVELRAVVPFNVERDYGGFSETKQMEVIFNMPSPDADRILDYLAWAQYELDQRAPGAIPLPPDLEATVERRISERTWEK